MQKDDEEFSKHTLNLYLGDYGKLQDFYPDIGAAPVIRRIVRRFIEQVEATGKSAIDAQVEIEI